MIYCDTIEQNVPAIKCRYCLDSKQVRYVEKYCFAYCGPALCDCDKMVECPYCILTGIEVAE